MRWLVAVFLVGCSASTANVEPVADGAVPTPEPDAAVDAADDAPKDAAPKPCDVGDACTALGGAKYACYGGTTCPAAACSVTLHDESGGNVGGYTESTCPASVGCVRSARPLDLQCKEEHNSAAFLGWSCPVGKTPPGVCNRYGGAGQDYCCR